VKYFDLLRTWQRPHAQALAARYFEYGSCHDGSDGGVGKTYVACAIAAEYKLSPIIVCPKSVVPSWRRVLLHFGVPANVYSYGLAWRRLGQLVPWGTGSYFKFRIPVTDIWFDECHRGNGQTSNNSKLMLAAKVANARIYTMSATPADNPLQLKALGFIHGLYKNKKDFNPWFIKSYGAYQDGLGKWSWDIASAKRLGHMGRLHDKLYGRCGQRLRKSEIVGFPETVIDTKVIPGYGKELDKMEKELREIYDSYETEAQMTDAEIVKQLKYRQMAELNKVEALVELTTDYIDQGFKVVHFVNFTETRFALCEALMKIKYKLGEIEGSQSAGTRQDYIDAFQRNELDVVVSQIDAGGEGVSLHDTRHGVPRAVFVCPTYKASTLHQVLQRVHRESGGFSLQFLVYFDEGIEDDVAKKVHQKLQCMEMLNDGELSGFNLVKQK
jgi:hypothetical protein